MELFDKIGKMTHAAVDKTANKVEISRLNSQINRLNSNIAAQKVKIGERYWEKVASGEPCDPDLSEMCDAIRGCEKQIGEIAREIQAVYDRDSQIQFSLPGSENTALICQSCQTPNEMGSVFCFNCGQPLNAARQ
jgi:hypothetical protein